MTVRTKGILTVIACIAFPLFLGSLSSFLSGDMREMYLRLAKPPLSPPGWLFGVVWPILYVLMGIASYRILVGSAEEQAKREAVILYALQLFVNFMWSIVFFGVSSFWTAFAVILILDILVALCIVRFGRIDAAAAGLLWPYMAWILFATYLNVAVALLN